VFVVEEPAHVEGVAVAAAGGGEPAPHRLCALDQGVDFGQLALCELAYLLVRGGAVIARGQQRAGVIEGEACALWPRR
jgi:hypothetical protein